MPLSMGRSAVLEKPRVKRRTRSRDGGADPPKKPPVKIGGPIGGGGSGGSNGKGGNNGGSGDNRRITNAEKLELIDIFAKDALFRINQEPRQRLFYVDAIIEHMKNRSNPYKLAFDLKTRRMHFFKYDTSG